MIKCSVIAACVAWTPRAMDGDGEKVGDGDCEADVGEEEEDEDGIYGVDEDWVNACGERESVVNSSAIR